MLSARYAVLTLLSMTWLAPQSLRAEPVPVRHAEGIVHGFLVLRDLDGTALADGDLIQTSQGTRVTTRALFQFKDGSVHDETAVYSQRQQVSPAHLPSDPERADVQAPAGHALIDARNRRVTVQYADEDGRPRTAGEQMELPPDLANGLVLTAAEERRARLAAEIAVVCGRDAVAIRLIKLELSVAGRERFSVRLEGREATHYVLKPDIGGISGLLAPLVGKQPPDSAVWILEGDAPAFREVRAVAVSRRTDLAHRARESFLAAPQDDAQ